MAKGLTPYIADQYEFMPDSWYDQAAIKKILQQRLSAFEDRVQIHTAFCAPFANARTGVAPSDQSLSIGGVLNNAVQNLPGVHAIACYKDRNHFTSLVIDTRGAQPALYYHDPFGHGLPVYMKAKLLDWLNQYYPGSNILQVLQVTTRRVQDNSYDCGPYSVRFMAEIVPAVIANPDQTQDPELYCKRLNAQEMAKQRLADAKHLQVQSAIDLQADPDITTRTTVSPALIAAATASLPLQSATVFWSPTKADEAINRLLDSGADETTVNAAIEKVLTAVAPAA